MQSIKSFIVVIFSVIMLSSCGGNSGLTLDPAMEKATIDSLITARTELLRDSVARVCEARLQSEVPAKVDSILQAEQTNN